MYVRLPHAADFDTPHVFNEISPTLSHFVCFLKLDLVQFCEPRNNVEFSSIFFPCDDAIFRIRVREEKFN